MANTGDKKNKAWSQNIFSAAVISFRKIFPSLAVKVGLAIVITEAVILAVIGFYYLQQLSVEMDQRTATRVQVPGILLQKSLMKYSAIADQHIMTDIVGDGLVEGMIVAANGNIFHAIDKQKIGKKMQDIGGLKAEWFSTEKITQQLIEQNDDAGKYLLSITPIFTLGSTRPFLYAFVKVNVSEIEERKKAAFRQYIFGALASILFTSIIIFLSFRILILDRIKRAAHFVEEVQKGNMDARFKNPGEDELGILENGMNAMVQNLNERGYQRAEAEQKLRIANETLEQRVYERTVEISDTLGRLQREVTNHTQTGKALRRQSSYIRLLQRITVAANGSTSVDGPLQVCLDTLCNSFNWPIGHVYTLSEENSSILVSANIWQFDEPQAYANFRDEAKKTNVYLGNGLPGKVMRSGTPIWLELSDQDDYALPEKAADHGYIASFAFPVILGREVVAVFEFFMDSREKPEPDFFEVMRDIGLQLGRVIERKRAEDELQKAVEEADIANQAKSEFLSNFSHELRTPMNAIVGYGQILVLNEKEPLTEIQSEQVSAILTAGNHLVELMDQVIDLARIETGEYLLDIEEIVVDGVIQDSFSLIEPLAKGRRVDLFLEATNAQFSSVSADPIALKQILLNLLSNAIKYGGSNHEVHVKCSLIDKISVRISVIDSGPGIPEKMLSDIFLPFKRMTSSITTEDGTGIGLSLSKQLADMMAGTMGVISTEGEGSTFWIELPLTKT